MTPEPAPTPRGAQRRTPRRASSRPRELPEGLFDLAPAPGSANGPAPATTAGERRRARQLACIAAGQHPLSLVLGPLPLHRDARRDDDRVEPGTPRCGGCRHREHVHGGARSYPKCTYGTVTRTRPATAAERSLYGGATVTAVAQPRVTHGEGTDVAAWWPACITYQPRPPAESDGRGTGATTTDVTTTDATTTDVTTTEAAPAPRTHGGS